MLSNRLFLLGSTNTQHKVLASVNRSKIYLDNQALPNAKKWLFWDDFPLIASKEADLAGGLANSLGHNAAKLNTTKTWDFRPNFRQDNNAANFNKYQNQNRSKCRPFFVPAAAPHRAKLHFYTKQWETVTSDSQALAIVKCFDIPFRQNL